MSKRVVIERIQNALKRHAISHENLPYRNMITDAKADLIEQYKHLQELNRSQLTECAKEDLLGAIQEALKGFETQKLLCATNLPCSLEELDPQNLYQKIPYDKPVEAFKEELFNIDTAILEATCGVANLGIVGVVSSKFAPRLTSLITLKCVILLDQSKIVQNLAQGLEALKNAGEGRLPTNMLFIGGPSRTADIELKTVFGVHGPMATHVILY